MKKIIIITVFLILFSLSNIYSAKITKIGTIELKQKSDFLIGVPQGFIITEENYFVICDTKSADFKIYDFKGNPIKIFGRRGYGPDEFSSPWLFDYSDNRMFISDTSTKKIYIYEQKDGINWIKKNEIHAVSVVDLKLMPDPDRILFCRFPIPDHPSGKYYIMLTQTIDTNEKDFLLPFEYQFGPNSEPVDFSKMRELSPSDLPDFLALPPWKYCDFYKDDIFFIWAGNLAIIKINISDKKINYFGQTTKNYVKPHVSAQFKKAYLEHNSKEYRDHIQKMSWIAKLFTDRNFVGVIYSNFDKENSRWKAFLQLYDHNGNFILDTQLSDFSSTYERSAYFYAKEKRILYCLSDNMRGEEVFFYISMYKIIE